MPGYSVLNSLSLTYGILSSTAEFPVGIGIFSHNFNDLPFNVWTDAAAGLQLTVGVAPVFDGFDLANGIYTATQVLQTGWEATLIANLGGAAIMFLGQQSLPVTTQTIEFDANAFVLVLDYEPTHFNKMSGEATVNLSEGVAQHIIISGVAND